MLKWCGPSWTLSDWQSIFKIFSNRNHCDMCEEAVTRSCTPLLCMVAAPAVLCDIWRPPSSWIAFLLLHHTEIDDIPMIILACFFLSVKWLAMLVPILIKLPLNSGEFDMGCTSYTHNLYRLEVIWELRCGNNPLKFFFYVTRKAKGAFKELDVACSNEAKI